MVGWRGFNIRARSVGPAASHAEPLGEGAGPLPTVRRRPVRDGSLHGTVHLHPMWKVAEGPSPGTTRLA